jgi:hypothetical protein
MDKDFSKYKKIIDDFSGQVLNSDFEARFSVVAKNIPKSERFLLKMELKRLAATCTRLIDLRGHVDGECKTFEHEERIHFLDDVALRVYKASYANYGSYTFGVYEATMNTENNFRVIYQREKSAMTKTAKSDAPKVLEKSQYPAQFYRFGPYHNRSEERMNFAISIQVSIDGKTHFDSTSSDISVNGCKFRINGLKAIKQGQMITLQFTGLEEEFQFGRNNTFTYEVKNVQKFENIQMVGVKRIYFDEGSQDGFKQFLIGFIQGNKRRYKINLDNTINALQSRSLEQFVLPKSNELPIFVQDEGGKLIPKYALTCNNNQGTFQYWQDENRYSTLYCLITPERLSRLKKATASGKNLLVYSFIHQSQGKVYFYTADETQLAADPEFMTQFLGFAASKPTFSITSLSLLDVFTSRVNSPLTLSNAIAKKDQYLLEPIPQEVKNLLEYTPYIIVANDITTKVAIGEYQQCSFEKINTSKLKNFGHKRLSKPHSVDEVGINYRNQRQELRFTYKTRTICEIAGAVWLGNSHDFSTSGLKIELEKPTLLVKGDVVNITFPSLQKITSAFDLKGLPYEVMRVNKAKTVVNLRVFVEKHQHIGRTFFKALIEKNRDKLTPDEYAMASPGLAKALRNVYSSSSNIPTLVVQTSGSRYKIETIASGENFGPFLTSMHQLSDRKRHYNLYPLLGHGAAMTLMTSSLKKMQIGDAPVKDILYISINNNYEMIDKAVTTKLASELGTDRLKHMFIKQALRSGQFFCVMVNLSRAGEPDMGYLNPELSYISSYAIHRGKQIEQDIWSVSGLIQVIDITQEVLFRYRLSRVQQVGQPTVS